VGPHTSPLTSLNCQVIAEREGHTLLSHFSRAVFNHTSAEKDLSTTYFPGLSHLYYTIGGKSEVTVTKGSFFSLDKPTLGTYLSALPIDYLSSSLYSFGCLFTEELFEISVVGGVSGYTVNASAPSGEVIYGTAKITDKTKSNSITSGDNRYLKITVA